MVKLTAFYATVLLCFVSIHARYVEFHKKDQETDQKPRKLHYHRYTLNLDLSLLKIGPNDCVDLAYECVNHAERKFCSNSFQMMKEICPHACRFCSNVKGKAKCKDMHADCPGWSQHADCLRYPVFMKNECSKSCQLCGEATDNGKFDDDVFCPLLAKVGFCKVNNTIKSTCSHSCEVYKDVKVDESKEKLPSNPPTYHPPFAVDMVHVGTKVPVTVPPPPSDILPNPEEQSPTTDSPDKNTPDENNPEENTPEENTPEKNTPEVNTPEENTPEENTPVDNTPGENTPETQPPPSQPQPAQPQPTTPPFNISGETNPSPTKTGQSQGENSPPGQNQPPASLPPGNNPSKKTKSSSKSQSSILAGGKEQTSKTKEKQGKKE